MPLFFALIALVLGTTPAWSQTGTLVVLNKGAASANIIDVASGRTLATLPTGAGPHEVVISADGRWAVGADYGGGGAGGNTLTVIDVPALRVARTIDLGRYTRPHGISFLPGDSLVAITSESTRNVVIVRVADGEIVQAISTEQNGSHMLAVVASGQRIYTGNIQSNSVSELNVADGRVTRTFDVPPSPEAITVTPNGAEVWVGSNARGTVSVISTADGSVTEAQQGFGWPYRILITPDQHLVIMPDLEREEVRFVERATRRELERLTFAGAGPQGVILSADARTLFLSLSRRNRVAVIDLASRRVTRHIDTGAGPDGIAFTTRVIAETR